MELSMLTQIMETHRGQEIRVIYQRVRTKGYLFRKGILLGFYTYDNIRFPDAPSAHEVQGLELQIADPTSSDSGRRRIAACAIVQIVTKDGKFPDRFLFVKPPSENRR